MTGNTVWNRLRGVVEALPKGESLDLIVERDEVHQALKSCADIAGRGWDPKVYCALPEWRSLMKARVRQCIQAHVREFQEEGLDSECIKMRMLAIWEADEAVRDGVSQRDHPTGFLGCGIIRRETAGYEQDS
jgi:hypothetical protein